MPTLSSHGCWENVTIYTPTTAHEWIIAPIRDCPIIIIFLEMVKQSLSQDFVVCAETERVVCYAGVANTADFLKPHRTSLK